MAAIIMINPLSVFFGGSEISAPLLDLIVVEAIDGCRLAPLSCSVRNSRSFSGRVSLEIYSICAHAFFNIVTSTPNIVFFCPCSFYNCRNASDLQRAGEERTTLRSSRLVALLTRLSALIESDQRDVRDS